MQFRVLDTRVWDTYNLYVVLNAFLSLGTRYMILQEMHCVNTFKNVTKLQWITRYNLNTKH